MFCTQCGTQASPEALFCAVCGSKLVQAPSSAVHLASTTATATIRRRPRGVWIISGFYLLSVGWTLLSFALTYSGAIRINAAQRAYFANLGILDYLSTILVSLLTLTATVLLFRLRKMAVLLFGVALALNIAIALLQAFTTNLTQALGGSGLLGMVFAWIILGAVVVYARKLDQSGLLS